MKRALKLLSKKSATYLEKPEFPTEKIIANPQAYISSVNQRKVRLHDDQSINDLIALHKKIEGLRFQSQQIRAQRNSIVKEVKSKLANVGKSDELPETFKRRSVQLKLEASNIENELRASENALEELLDTVPNLVEPSASQILGEFQIVNQTKELAPEKLKQCKERDHVDIATRLGILDIPSGSRVSGQGNAYLVGDGALLEQALIHYALTKCTREFGFTMVSTPSLVRPEYNSACGFRPRGVSTQIYEIKDFDLCLSGTAEIPLAAQMAMRRLKNLPELRCAVMRSYRAESGKRGAEARGLYRLHEFSKVEMFVWCSPEQSTEFLHKLVQIQENIFGELLDGIGVPMRTINVAPTDLGAPAYQKYDIEAWMPGRGSWGEISSASNCLDYQARRLHTKDCDGNFVHTLNATALAIPRIVLAIIENGWDPQTQKLNLPKVLWPYMGCESIG